MGRTALLLSACLASAAGIGGADTGVDLLDVAGGLREDGASYPGPSGEFASGVGCAAASPDGIESRYDAATHVALGTLMRLGGRLHFFREADFKATTSKIEHGHGCIPDVHELFRLRIAEEPWCPWEGGLPSQVLVFVVSDVEVPEEATVCCKDVILATPETIARVAERRLVAFVGPQLGGDPPPKAVRRIPEREFWEFLPGF